MAIPKLMARKQTLLHLLTSFNVPFVVIPCYPALSSRPLDFLLHEHQESQQFLYNSPVRWMFHRAPGLILPVGKNTIRKFNPKSQLISKWPFVISFDHLFAENSPRIFLRNNLSCLPSRLKFQIALPALRSAQFN